MSDDSILKIPRPFPWPAPPLPKSGAELIAEERTRQIDIEGWTPENDDDHDGGLLAIQAAALAVSHTDCLVIDELGKRDPWDLARKHGRDAIRSLVIAGALIAAEIDRLHRSKLADPPERP
jgi:hypothetical protein